MSDQKTCADTLNTTFSPELECGHSLFDELVGPTPDPSGQAVAPANLSAAQAHKLGLLTSGTYGRTSTGLSLSSALQKSLESKLQARLQNLGSTLYKLTWKPWATPSLQSRSRLRASVPRTSATDFSGWVTPTTRDHKDTPGMVAQREGKSRVDQLPRQAYLTGWPTPTTRDYKGESGRGRQERKGHPADTLPNAAALISGWPTPTAMDVVDRKAIRPSRVATGRKSGYLTEDVLHLKGWPTPTATDAIKQGNVSPRPGAMGLSETVSMLRENPQAARLTASGELLIGSSAEMVNGGQLNPALPRWLMACPPAWDECSPNFEHWRNWQDLMARVSPELKAIEPVGSKATETPSTRKPRKSSSKPTSNTNEALDPLI